MGEHQCRECGHVTTGFEQQQFEADRAVVDTKDAEIGRLRAALQQIADGLGSAALASRALQPLT